MGDCINKWKNEFDKFVKHQDRKDMFVSVVEVKRLIDAESIDELVESYSSGDWYKKVIPKMSGTKDTIRNSAYYIRYLELSRKSAIPIIEYIRLFLQHRTYRAVARKLGIAESGVRRKLLNLGFRSEKPNIVRLFRNRGTISRIVPLGSGHIKAIGIDPDKELYGRWVPERKKGFIRLYIEEY